MCCPERRGLNDYLFAGTRSRLGHFSRTIAKGLDTTTWIWNLHADAHDFDSHTNDLEEISHKIFSAHFSHLSIIFLWLSGMYFHGARFSNYEALLRDPTHIAPSAEVVWPIVGQEILNGDVGGGFRGIQITSRFFQISRASGITSELQLYCIAIGALVFAALMLFAEFLTFRGGLDPVTGGLWLTNIAHHHLAIAIFFLIVGHMYRTNWGIGHGLKDILEAHKGPFTDQGHKGLYEILTTSWHAQLSLNLAMLGSLTIVVAYHMYSMPHYPYLATDYGHPQDMFTDTAIQLQPIFAQWIQNTHTSAPGAIAPSTTTSTSLTWGGGDLVVVGGKVALLPIPLGTADFLVRPIAHAIWDPHFGQPVVEAFTRWGAPSLVNIAYFGVYQWWYTIGLRTNEDLCTRALFLLFLSALSLIASWLHLQPKWKPSVSGFKNAESRPNHHLIGLFGVSSLAWTRHLVHVAIPGSQGEYVQWNNFLDVLLHPQGLGPLFSGRLGRGHKGLYDTINNSIHFQLGLALAFLGVITSLVAQHMYSLPAYAFIAQDFTTQATLYTHHQYIAGFIMTGAFAHRAIFFY
ncbi:hypothetical protein REPUB_Repub01dG0132100 [Reevesia pubescens]